MDTPALKETSYYDYTKASALYDQYRQPYGLNLLRQLLQFKPTPISLIVDFGCGTGNHLLAVQDLFEKAIGLDINEGMLGQFEKKIKADSLETKIDLKKASCLDVPLPSNTCDVALMTQVLQHLGAHENRQKAFNEAYRVLKPRGIFVINHTFDKQVQQLWARSLVPSGRAKVLQVCGTLQDLLSYGANAGFSFQRMVPHSDIKSKLGTFTSNPESSTSYLSILSPQQKEEMKSHIQTLQKESKTLLDLEIDVTTSEIIGDSGYLLFLKE